MITDLLDFTGRGKSVLQRSTWSPPAEWAQCGIRASCARRARIERPRAIEAWWQEWSAVIGPPKSLGRTTTPDEMANMIVLFASDAVSSVTGQVIAVNGGTPRSGVPDD